MFGFTGIPDIAASIGLVGADKFKADLTGIGAKTQALGGIFKASLAVGALAAAAAIAKSVSAASDFQSSFAGITKTVEGVSDNFGNLNKEGIALAKQMRQMAKEIPINVNELNKIGEIAGSLGIAKQDIASFTKTIAQLGTTSNLSYEEGAMAIGRFLNVTQQIVPVGMTVSEQASRIASAIVDLGNKTAATESDITTFAARLAATGATIGLSQHEILAFSAALASVGVEAEAGGTAFSRVFADMSVAVSSGGKKLEEFARTAGMEVPKFAKLFKEDASEAVMAFLTGLNNMKQSVEGVYPVLEKLELGDMRVRNALVLASSATTLFNNALIWGKTAYEENTAMAIEAAKRYNTFDSQVTLLKNNLNDLFITIGNDLLPALTNLVKTLNENKEIFGYVAEAVKFMIDPAKGFAEAIKAISGETEILGVKVQEWGKVAQYLFMPFKLLADYSTEAVKAVGKFYDWIKNKTKDTTDAQTGYYEDLHTKEMEYYDFSKGNWKEINEVHKAVATTLNTVKPVIKETIKSTNDLADAHDKVKDKINLVNSTHAQFISDLKARRKPIEDFKESFAHIWDVDSKQIDAVSTSLNKIVDILGGKNYKMPGQQVPFKDWVDNLKLVKLELDDEPTVLEEVFKKLGLIKEKTISIKDDQKETNEILKNISSYIDLIVDGFNDAGIASDNFNKKMSDVGDIINGFSRGGEIGGIIVAAEKVFKWFTEKSPDKYTAWEDKLNEIKKLGVDPLDFTSDVTSINLRNLDLINWKVNNLADTFESLTMIEHDNVAIIEEYTKQLINMAASYKVLIQDVIWLDKSMSNLKFSDEMINKAKELINILGANPANEGFKTLMTEQFKADTKRLLSDFTSNEGFINSHIANSLIENVYKEAVYLFGDLASAMTSGMGTLGSEFTKVLEKSGMSLDEFEARYGDFDDIFNDATLSIEKFSFALDKAFKIASGQFDQFETDADTMKKALDRMIYLGLDKTATEVDERIGLMLGKMYNYIGTLNHNSQAYKDAQASLTGIIDQMKVMGYTWQDIQKLMKTEMPKVIAPVVPVGYIPSPFIDPEKGTQAAKKALEEAKEKAKNIIGNYYDDINDKIKAIGQGKTPLGAAWDKKHAEEDMKAAMDALKKAGLYGIVGDFYSDMNDKINSEGKGKTPLGRIWDAEKTAADMKAAMDALKKSGLYGIVGDFYSDLNDRLTGKAGITTAGKQWYADRVVAAQKTLDDLLAGRADALAAIDKKYTDLIQMQIDAGSKIQDKINDLVNDRVELDETYAAKINDQLAARKELEGQIADIQAQRLELDKQYAASVAELNAQIPELEKTIAELQTRRAEIEANTQREVSTLLAYAQKINDTTATIRRLNGEGALDSLSAIRMLESTVSILTGTTRSFTREWQTMLDTVMGGKKSAFDVAMQNLSQAADMLEKAKYFGQDIGGTQIEADIANMIASYRAFLQTLNPDSQAYIDAMKAIDDLSGQFTGMGGMFGDKWSVEDTAKWADQIAEELRKKAAEAEAQGGLQGLAINVDIEAAKAKIIEIKDAINAMMTEWQDKKLQLNIDEETLKAQIVAIDQTIKDFVQEWGAKSLAINLAIEDNQKQLDVIDQNIHKFYADWENETIKIDIDITEASGKLRTLYEELVKLRDQWNGTTTPNINVPQGLHSGGFVKAHSGLLAPWEMPAILRTDEMVLRPEATRKFGASNLLAFNASLDAGTLGGKSSASPVIHVHVHEAGPKTWIEITDKNIHPRIQERERKYQISENPYATN